MPSAGNVVDDHRLAFVFGARPDLLAPFLASLDPAHGTDPGERLTRLGETAGPLYDALVSVVVFGYYTDATVRDLIGYPGQQAIQIYSWKVPEYVENGMIDRVLERGPVWRDPATGVRAVTPLPDPS
jgi:hypothetical protein